MFMSAKLYESTNAFAKKISAAFFAGLGLILQALERRGTLRHLRISNQGDMVPTPPVPGYTQNGVNFFLYLDEEQEMQLDYRNTKSLLSQTSTKALANHMFGEYNRRLFDNPKNKEILSRPMEEIYRTGGDFTN
jgi:hypothetical protein